MQVNLIFTTFVLTTLLTGCAGMNGQFNCHRIDGKGVGCTSVDQVNQLADRGAFHSTVNHRAQRLLDDQRVSLTRPYATPDVGQPLRQPEQVQRVWIAPYQDSAGRYVGPTYVAMVVKAAHWMNFQPNVIRDSDEEE